MTGHHGADSNNGNNDEPNFAIYESSLYTREYREVCETRNRRVSNDPVGVWRSGSGRSGVGSRCRPGLYTYGPFQWCSGQDLPNDPPRPDGELVWDMSVCHTYYFDYWD